MPISCLLCLVFSGQEGSHLVHWSIQIHLFKCGTVQWHADNSLQQDLALEGAAIMAPLVLPRTVDHGQLCVRCRARADGTVTMSSQIAR